MRAAAVAAASTHLGARAAAVAAGCNHPEERAAAGEAVSSLHPARLTSSKAPPEAVKVAATEEVASTRLEELAAAAVEAVAVVQD